MKKIVASLLSATFAFSSTAAMAGGPVVIEEEGQPEVIAESPRSGWIVPAFCPCGRCDDLLRHGHSCLFATFR